VIAPNLATRPFLNIRPVWLVTAVAVALTVILLALNLRLFLVANRTLVDESATRDALLEKHKILEAAVRKDVEALERVPWRSLTRRVDATNLILREHSFSWLGMLDDIESVMPYDVRLTKIAPGVSDDGAILSLSLIALNREAMLELLDNLVNDPKFSDPTPSSESTPEENASAAYVMNLRVNYHPNPGAL
jgi:type IV pilus assembly protein PilN